MRTRSLHAACALPMFECALALQVVSTDKLVRGARVMRERGIAVPVSDLKGPHCAFCFRVAKSDADARGCCAEVAQALAHVEGVPALTDLVGRLSTTMQVSVNAHPPTPTSTPFEHPLTQTPTYPPSQPNTHPHTTN
jgi:hypothetical protein